MMRALSDLIIGRDTSGLRHRLHRCWEMELAGAGRTDILIDLSGLANEVGGYGSLEDFQRWCGAVYAIAGPQWIDDAPTWRHVRAFQAGLGARQWVAVFDGARASVRETG